MIFSVQRCGFRVAPMGAIEHLKTLCCLGLPPESAMIAVTPLLHEIIPHGWSRMALLEPDATIGDGYSENPSCAAILRERMWRFSSDPSSPMPLWKAAYRSGAIGWTLHMQGRNWLNGAWYREIESPLDSCWLLGAMIRDRERSIAYVSLSRPRSAHPFTVDDVQRLDPLRPWLAHAFRKPASNVGQPEDHDQFGGVGRPVLSGHMIMTADERIMFQTAGVDNLLGILCGEALDFTREAPVRDRLPVPISLLDQRITGAAKGTSHIPPRVQVSTSFGILALEAKWLMPAGAIPADLAEEPMTCPIIVAIELREHAIAHAARVLRESGATPAQVKVGIQLALGRAKPDIADELGLRASTVADLAKKLYQILDVHNATQLSTKIWLGEKYSGQC